MSFLSKLFWIIMIGLLIVGIFALLPRIIQWIG